MTRASFDSVALSWSPSGAHGWGVFAANLIQELIRIGKPSPSLLAPVELALLSEEDRGAFRPLAEAQARLERQTADRHGTLTLPRTCVLHALGNSLRASETSSRYRGEPNAGFAFFERVDFPEDVVSRSSWLDLLVAGSTWNAERLRELGFPKVGCVLQGVDVERFQPSPPQGRFGDRFVIFSGGKLELRKGQDLVIAAYREFHRRHPESLLVTNWMNPWPAIMADIAASPHVEGCPSPRLPAAQAIHAWVCAQGVPEDAHVDLGWVPNARMPAVLGECHAALLPSRCEGGTNLVAMEAMATGLPCILAANSGHLDILAEERAYPLRRQSPLSFGPPGSAHWRESDVDEILEALEAIHSDREEARRRGRSAHAFAQGLSWRAQVPRLLEAIEALSERAD
jgi:glycosyltransferase involved in cell wall biosynthesis